MANPLSGTFRRAGRLVVSYWPAMVTWYMFGLFGQFVMIEIAGWVGVSSPAGGLALMPIAILFRLIAFVAMLLIVRGGMPALTALAPIPTRARDRRGEFVDALLAGVLPFFAFYFAWGFLGADMRKYYLRLYEVQTSRAVSASFTGAEIAENAYGLLKLTWSTAATIAVVFVLRRAIKRLSSRLPRLVPIVAVYLEAVWVFLSALVIGQLTTRIRTWADSRQGIIWFGDLRRWLTGWAAPLDGFLDLFGWLIGEVGGVLLYPLAWLTIAGVVYGHNVGPTVGASRLVSSRLKSSTLVSERLLADERIGRVRQRVTAAPKWLLGRLRDLWDDLIERFKPIGNALSLMWHVGPVLIGGYVLAFRVIEWLNGEIAVVVPRLFGPHPYDFWLLYGSVIALVAPTLTAPLTVGVVGSTVNSVLATLRRPAEAPAEQRVDEPTASPATPSRDAP